MHIFFPWKKRKFLKARKLTQPRLDPSQFRANTHMSWVGSVFTSPGLASWKSQLGSSFLFPTSKTTKFYSQEQVARVGGGPVSSERHPHSCRRRRQQHGRSDVQRDSSHSYGPHFHFCKMRALAKPQIPLRPKYAVTNLQEGGFRKLTSELIEPCGVVAWNINLLFITIHFLSLAYQPKLIKHHSLSSTLGLVQSRHRWGNPQDPWPQGIIP